METSAELLYLLKFYDPKDEFGFKDELERSEALQWLFFWHGSGAPYLGQLGHFTRFAKEKIPCRAFSYNFWSTPFSVPPFLPSLFPDPPAENEISNPAFGWMRYPDAIERYTNESLRVIGVLEIRLSGKYTGEPRDYLAGKGKGKYSIADIGTWSWVKYLKDDLFTDEQRKPLPNVLKWIDRIAERPAVQRGISEKYVPQE